MMTCNSCHDTGLIVEKLPYSKKIEKYYILNSCHNCFRGTHVRVHTQMHIQDEEPCDCEYRYIFDYWKSCKLKLEAGHANR